MLSLDVVVDGDWAQGSEASLDNEERDLGEEGEWLGELISDFILNWKNEGLLNQNATRLLTRKEENDDDRCLRSLGSWEFMRKNVVVR